MCQVHSSQELLCPVCDRREILKIAAGVIEKRGKVGGKTAAKNMTPEQRKERAKKAAKARWGTQ